MKEETKNPETTRSDKPAIEFSGMLCLSCGVCGASGVRIFRPYGNFYRPKDNRCNDCVTDTERGWFVPTITDNDKTIWGFLSAPMEAREKFYALPEKNPFKPIWDSYLNKWSER